MNFRDLDVHEILELLGYSQDWLTAGVITDDLLREQHLEFRNSDDKNQEHYRHAAFARFINGCSLETQQQFDALLGLSDQGADGVDLRPARAIALIPLMDEAQLEAARSGHLELFVGPVLQKYERRRLVLRLKRLGVDAVFDEVKAIGEAEVEIAVLAEHGLRREHVLWLSQNGSARRIRNQAKQVVQSRRFRE